MEKLWDKNTGLATIILLFIILKKNVSYSYCFKKCSVEWNYAGQTNQ